MNRPRSYQINDFMIPAVPSNRVICLIHLMPGDDGGRPIWDHLANTYEPLGTGDRLFVHSPANVLRNATGRTFVIDVPYGRSVTEQAAKYDLPARAMTTPVVILPSRNGFFELDGMGVLNPIMNRERPVAFAIGDVSTFSPEDAGKSKSMVNLSTKVRGFLNYVESRYQVPVVYVATGPDGPVLEDETVRRYDR